MSIKLDNISFAFGNTLVIDTISAEIPINKITAIVGNNGSGKTTLLHILAGIYPLQSGTICMDIKNPICVFQNAVILNRTVEQNIWHCCKALNIKEYKQKTTNALKQVQLNHMANHNAHSLSGGQKMQLQIARLLAVDSHLWLLDEPHTGLDIKARKHLNTAIHTAIKNGKTIIIISHDMAFIKEHADCIFIMHNKTLQYHDKENEICLND